MEKNILTIAFRLLFLGGIFGIAEGMYLFFSNSAPVQYGIMGIGGGAFLVWSALVAFIKGKL